MNTIKAKSNNGFKIESGWMTCDKELLKGSLFINLKVNDKIDNLVTKRVMKNNKEYTYVINFIVITTMNDSEASKVVSPYVSQAANSDCLLTPSDIKANDRDRNILKGQCLNIAFKDIDITDSKFREQGIRYAQKLFVELEEANFYNW